MEKNLGKYKHDIEKRIDAQVLLKQDSSNMGSQTSRICKQKMSWLAKNKIKERTRRTKLNEELSIR